MFNRQKFDIKPSIVIEGARIDTWKDMERSLQAQTWIMNEFHELYVMITLNSKIGCEMKCISLSPGYCLDLRSFSGSENVKWQQKNLF